MVKRKTWYWLHRWLSFLIGVFFIIWTVSGIVMVLPGRWFEPSQINRPATLDYKNAIISPAEAIAIVEEAKGEPVQVVELDPAIIQGKYVHEVVLDTGEIRLIDANTGDTIWITKEIAEQIARDFVEPSAIMKELELLENHDLIYPFGPLPVYRVTFEGDQSNIYYIHSYTGGLSRSNNLTRIRGMITSLHTFEPIKLIPNADRFRKGSLVLTSIIGLVTTIIGYWMFFLPYLQRLRQRKNTQSLQAKL